jgi:flagellar basal-body rod protein FlgG
MNTITAATEIGMLNDVEALRVVSHNLANVGTVGYKREIGVAAPFDAQLRGASAAALEKGLGASLSSFTDRTPGTLTHTGNPLDVAIEGDNAYLVIDSGHQEIYSRQGTLRLDADGQLVNLSGQPVLTTNGAVRLTGPAPAIDQEGNIRDNGTLVGQLKLVKIDNPQSLTALGNGQYVGSDATVADSADAARVRQGYTEAANVITMNEMINLIDTVRHFETSQKLLQGYDGMLERALTDLGNYQ